MYILIHNNPHIYVWTNDHNSPLFFWGFVFKENPNPKRFHLSSIPVASPWWRQCCNLAVARHAGPWPNGWWHGEAPWHAWFSGDPATLPSRFHGYEMKNAFYGDSTWLDHEIRFITTIVELFDLMLEPYKPTYTAGKHHIELHDFASWRSWSNVQAGVINQFMWKKKHMYVYNNNP
jgi:hypothetical protein